MRLMVAEAVRQRQQFARKIKSLTAMGRASAYVLCGIPFFMALRGVDTFGLPAVGWVLGWILAFIAVTSAARWRRCRILAASPCAICKA